MLCVSIYFTNMFRAPIQDPWTSCCETVNAPGALGILSWIMCPLLLLLADGAALRSIASSKKNFQWKTTSLPIETIRQEDNVNCCQLNFHWNWFHRLFFETFSREEWRERQVLCQAVDVFRKTIVIGSSVFFQFLWPLLGKIAIWQKILHLFPHNMFRGLASCSRGGFDKTTN